jgi:hypothetical protein
MGREIGEKRKLAEKKKHEEESKGMLGKYIHSLREEGASLHQEVPHNGRH